MTGFIDDVTDEEKKHLVIPGTYQGLPVTSIGENAFYNVLFIRSVVFPDSIEVIKSQAFCCVHGFWDYQVKLPSNLKRIEANAFYQGFDEANCPVVILPEGLEYIGEYAFASNGFNGDLIIPGTVKEIASGAFSSSFEATNLHQ